MKFNQSRFQDYFSRCYEALLYLVYFCVAAYVLKSVLSVDIGLVQGVIVSLLITVTTLIFIKINFKSGSQSLEITDEKIIYMDDQYSTTIERKDYEGYKITKFFPHRVVIQNKVYGETSFSYYAFSSSQRKQIFTLLDKYHP